VQWTATTSHHSLRKSVIRQNGGAGTGFVALLLHLTRVSVHSIVGLPKTICEQTDGWLLEQ